MSGLQMPWIKKTQNVDNFGFHGNGTNWPSVILQNTPISKQIILLMQTEVWIINTHSGKPTSYLQNPKKWK